MKLSLPKAIWLICVGILCSTTLTAQESSSISSALHVSTDQYDSVMFYPVRSAPATVSALNISQVPAQISAVVNHLPVRVGDEVAQGDLLAELDCRQAELNFQIESARSNQLEASLGLEQRNLARRERLAEGGNLGEAELDRTRTEVNSLQSQVLSQQAVTGIAALNTERCIVKAPYSGVVSARLANEGENLNIGQAVVELVQLSTLEVQANIALDDLDSFQNAGALMFMQSGVEYGIRLRSLLPLVEQNTRTRQARFEFIADSPVAGSSGRLSWESPEPHLPARYLQLRDGVAGVFVVESGAEGDRARFIEAPLAQEGRPVPFDLPEQTQIISDGRYGLVDGQLILVP